MLDNLCLHVFFPTALHGKNQYFWRDRRRKKKSPPLPRFLARFFARFLTNLFTRFLARFLTRDEKYSFAGSTGAKIQFCRFTGTKKNTVLRVLRGDLLIYYLISLFSFFLRGGIISSVYRRKQADQDAAKKKKDPEAVFGLGVCLGGSGADRV